MQKGDNQGRTWRVREAEKVVMLAKQHAQAGMKLAHVREWRFTACEALHAALQAPDVATYLCVTPFTTRVADDVAQIRFRRLREEVDGFIHP